MSGTAVLHIIGGNDRGKQHSLNRAETRIGRGIDQDVVLADIAVSRRHVTIVMEGQRWRLKDLGSGNGSLVNGQRTDSVVLNDGDQIEIGNTLMRFDHAASRAAAPLPSNYAPPAARAPFGEDAYPAPYQQAPSAAVPMLARGEAPGYVAPSHLANSVSPRNKGTGRKLAFVAMGVISIAGLAAIVSRTVLARPITVANEAEDLYRLGLRLFAAGDYDLAKGKFTEAIAQAEDAPEPRRYAHLCDTESQARTALRNAERALVSRRYAEAVRALSSIDSGSIYYDQGIRQRKETAPKAASEMVDEARRLLVENPDEARARLKVALELDPDSSDARDLLQRVRGGNSLNGLDKGAGSLIQSPSALGPSADLLAKESKRHHAKSDEDPDAGALKLPKTATLGAPDSKAAWAAYKARDFIGAQRTFMQDSMRQSEKQGTKTVEFANQVRALQQLVERAEADEAKNHAQAVKEYEQAILLDQKLSRGVHTAYLRQHVSGLGIAAAKASFSSGNYEAAYQAALQAQRGGVDVNSLLKQLEQKASDLVAQGVSVQKSNIGQAKQSWRMVLKMVPSSSPNYTKAYSLLNSASTPKRDEDED